MLAPATRVGLGLEVVGGVVLSPPLPSDPFVVVVEDPPSDPFVVVVEDPPLDPVSVENWASLKTGKYVPGWVILAQAVVPVKVTLTFKGVERELPCNFTKSGTG